MFGEVCNNLSHPIKWENETVFFDHELACTVSKTVFVLFSLIGVAGLIGNAMVVLGKSEIEFSHISHSIELVSVCSLVQLRLVFPCPI